MKKNIWTLSFCLVFCLTSCTTTANTFTDTPLMETAIETTAQTAIPTFTLTSTPSPMLTTPTSVPSTPTLDVPPEARLHFHTLEYFNDLPDFYHSGGHMVLLQENSVPGTVVILNLATGESTLKDLRSSFSQEELGILSHDEKWLIRLAHPEINKPDTKEYEVLSVEGESINRFVLPQGWRLRYSWINEHQILADRQPDPDEITYQTMAIDPFTGEQQMLPFDFPDAYELVVQGLDTENAYDPTLNYVIYLAHLYDAPPGRVLRDVKKQTNIVSVPVTSGFSPIWSPEGTWFALGTNREILSVSVDGERKSLTYMEKFDSVWIGPRAEKLSWSPNGQRIAFGLLPVPQPNLEGNACLAILDVETETVDAYCLADFDILSGMTFFSTVWAPDSKQLLVPARQISTDNWGFTLLINLEDETAINLGERLRPLYFLSSLPSVWMP